MQPSAAPDPVGLAAALNLLGQPNIFRDMSGMKELQELLSGLASGAVDLAKAQQLATRVTQALGGQVKQAGPGEVKPERQVDGLQVINEAVRQGLLTERQANDATIGLLGGEIRQVADVGSATLGRRHVYEDIQVVIRTFIPSPIVAISDPTGSLPVYQVDNRDFSMTDGTHRSLIRAVINPDPTRETPLVGAPEAEFGSTHEFDRNNARPVPGKPSWWWELRPGVVQKPRTDTQKVTPDRLRIEYVRIFSPDMWRVRLVGAAALAATDPLVRNFAFDVDTQLMLDLLPVPPQGGELVGKTKYFLWGRHDGFPAYEVYLNGHPVYRYDPVSNNASPANLAPPMDRNVATYKDGSSTETGFAWVPPRTVQI